MKLQEVPQPLIDEVWPRVAHWLADAITHGDQWWTLDGLREELEQNDNAALFLVIDQSGIHAAGVVLCEDKPNGEREAHFPAVGGENFRQWRHVLADVEAWARSKGAQSITITGRVGWQRLISDYKRRAVILEKAL